MLWTFQYTTGHACQHVLHPYTHPVLAKIFRISVQDFYGLTLDALREAQNDRLWFKTQLKLCGLWFKLKEYGRGAKIVRELHRYPAWPAPCHDMV